MSRFTVVIVTRFADEQTVARIRTYKDIFQMAKQRVEIFASVMPKTQVPMLEVRNEKIK